MTKNKVNGESREGSIQKRNNERGVYKTEFEVPLQFFKGLTHANRATNPGMIRCVLDDRLKRSPKTEKESRHVCIYSASERNLLL